MPGYAVSDLEASEHARIIKSLVSPRPIGWISTQSADGLVNLAPYSCFNYVNRSPPAVMFRSGSGGPDYKDTATNVLETGEFVVNVVTEHLADRVDETSAPLASDENEFEYAGLEPAESVRVSAPRVAESVANMECTLYDSTEVFGSIVIFGEVEYVHLADEILTDGKVDMHKLPMVGRLGGPFYTTVEIMDLERKY